VTAARRNVDGRHGSDGELFAVQLDMSCAFEDDIDFGHGLVVMGAGGFLDFEQMDGIIQQWNNFNHFNESNSFLPSYIELSELPTEDLLLQEQQKNLSGILETANSYEHALKLLRSSNLSGTEWEVEKWKPHMLETAIAIAQKWKNGFN